MSRNKKEPGRAGLPRVLYCAPEDAFSKKLGAQQDDFELECRPISLRSSPQQIARSHSAEVLLLKIKKEFDLKQQEWLSHNDASVPILVLCQNGTVTTAVHALQYGVFDYFCMSQDLKVVVKRVNDAIARKSIPLIKKKADTPEQLLLGNNVRIREINAQAQELARVREPLLLSGEVGTGKQHLAYGLYRISHPDLTPFVHYDCRLLQHVARYDRVSLNHLIRTRLQKLSRRALGVLYLSHVEQLNTDQQKELFGNWQSTSVRLIASHQSASGAHLAGGSHAVAASVDIPSLRQHREDIPMMADHFIRRTAKWRRIRQKSLSLEVVQLMQEYPWPGNVQELSNAIERMMILEPSPVLSACSWRAAQGSIASLRPDQRNHLTTLIEEVLQSSPQWQDGSLYENFMERMEKMLIQLVMPRVDYNQADAAKILASHATRCVRKFDCTPDHFNSTEKDASASLRICPSRRKGFWEWIRFSVSNFRSKIRMSRSCRASFRFSGRNP